MNLVLKKLAALTSAAALLSAGLVGITASAASAASAPLTMTFEDNDTSGYFYGTGMELGADFGGNVSSRETSLPGGRAGAGLKIEITAGSETWSGTTIIKTTTDAQADGTLFSDTARYAEIDVYSTVSGDMMFKLEGGCNNEIRVAHTGSGWETLKFEDLAVTGCTIGSFFPLNGVAGRDGNIVYIDNLSLPGFTTPDVFVPVTSPSTLVDFATANALTNFGGTSSAIVSAPAGASAGDALKVTTGGDCWGGTTIQDQATSVTLLSDGKTTVTANVHVPAAGARVRLKLENSLDNTILVESDAIATAAGWNRLSWNLSGYNAAKVYNRVSVFPGFHCGFEANPRVTGDYYFDDIAFNGAVTPALPVQVTSPETLIDFEGSNSFIDFGGSVSSTVEAPAGASVGSAAKIVAGGECWAGTTLVTKGTSETMLSAGKTSVTANVYAPAAGAMVRLKLEYSEDTNIAVQADATATAAGWNRLTWDLSGYDNTKVYNKINVFPGFSCDNANNPRGDYYIDDIAFNGAVTPKFTQTVTLEAGSSAAIVGDADRNLSATVKVGENTVNSSVVFATSTSNVCSVEGNVLKFLSAGECVVSASQAATDSAAEGVATASIQVSELPTPTITWRAIPSGSKLVSADGFFIYPSSDSTSAMKISFKTPSVCSKGPLGATHVLNLKTGTCRIEISHLANSDYGKAAKTLSYLVSKAGTTPVVDAGNVGDPILLSSTGAPKGVLSEILSWKKSTGALKISSRGVWVGPIKATASFKIGTKSYSCSVNYGTLRGASGATATKLKTFTAPSFCSSSKASDKSALAALKKLSSTVSVKIEVVRELRNPVDYTSKGQKVTRTVFAKIGK